MFTPANLYVCSFKEDLENLKILCIFYVLTEVYTIPHIQAPINAKKELRGLKHAAGIFTLSLNGLSILKTDSLLRKMDFV